MSSDPPKTRLSGRSGSYSQMAVVVSTAAIFVICPITSIVPKLTTCPRHLGMGEQQPRNVHEDLEDSHQLVFVRVPFREASDLVETLDRLAKLSVG